MLELKLFGTGQACYDGQVLDSFPSQQASLLFCYLLLNPHAHRRERLAAVFWDESPANVSRKHLSQTLWRLRHTLQAANVPIDEYLRIDKERIAFNPASRYWLDIEVFETTITRYQDIAGHKLTSEQASALEKAVELYGGDLLEGIYEEWCLYDRERLNLLYLDALGKLMIFHERHQTYEQGLACGQRILNCDNTRERIHQQMMRLYQLAGHRTEALAQYKRCAQILRDELGVPPMQETTQLYQQIARNQFRPIDLPHHYHDTALSPLVRSDESLQKLATLSLQKLTRLQAIIDETSTELQYLERLIKKTLLGP